MIPPGGALTYTLALVNDGLSDAAAVNLTDTLPLSVTYIANSLAYPPGSGNGGFDPATQVVTWTGVVSVGLPVTITFQVTLSVGLADGDAITNTAIISDGVSEILLRTAVTPVSLPPIIVATYPADGETDVPVSASLVITFSEVMEPSSLYYAVSPDPGGWAIGWNPDATAVTLDPADWGYSQTVTVTISAQDTEGDLLTLGPAPNPWAFTTSPMRLYIPLVMRN